MSTDDKPEVLEPTPVPALETERLLLRGIAEGDADFLTRLDCDPEVMRYINRGPLPLKSAQRYVQMLIEGEHYYRCFRRQRRFGKWTVRGKQTGLPMGWVEAFKFSHGRNGEWLGDWTAFGYEFFAEFWNQGFATEAVCRVLDYQKEDFPDERFFAYVREENGRSRRVLEKLGFRLLEDRVKDESGSLCLLYSLEPAIIPSEGVSHS